MRRGLKYDSTLPGRMYKYFVGYDDTGAPSFVKFARLAGYTLEELCGFRSRKKFDAAWRECGEIRRDYLIDMALTKRHDASFSKFLLSELDKEVGADGSPEEVKLTLEVIGD